MTMTATNVQILIIKIYSTRTLWFSKIIIFYFYLNSFVNGKKKMNKFYYLIVLSNFHSHVNETIKFHRTLIH